MKQKPIYNLEPPTGGMIDIIKIATEKLHSGLTELQQHYYPAAMWLFNTESYRGSGRSYLIATVLIEVAIHNQMRWIHVVDHYRLGRECETWIMRQVVDIASKMDICEFEFNMMSLTFRFTRFNYEALNEIIREGKSDKEPK